MNKILELREKRARIWSDAKAFLDSHRSEDGFLSYDDQLVYEKMESDVVKLGKEIERLEIQARIDRDIDSDGGVVRELIDKENWKKMEQNLLNEIEYLKKLLEQKAVVIETLENVIQIITTKK